MNKPLVSQLIRKMKDVRAIRSLYFGLKREEIRQPNADIRDQYALYRQGM